MKRRIWLAMAMMVATAWAGAQNPATNGSFEELDDEGRPLDWFAVGHDVRVTTDAVHGDYAIHMIRDAAGIEHGPETGLNRGWREDSGTQGAMLDELKGAIRFRYKAPRAEPGATMDFFVIAMSGEAREFAGFPRIGYRIPENHVGDGLWHEGLVAYDLTDAPFPAKFIQIAPRLTGTGESELILDDVRWVESAGSAVAFNDFRIWELTPAQADLCDVSVLVRNIGDEVYDGNVTLDPGRLGLGAEDNPAVRVRIAPGRVQRIEWRLTGERRHGDRLTIEAQGSVLPAQSSLTLAADIVDAWLETERLILWEGAETRVDLVLENIGNAAAPLLSLRVDTPANLELVDPAIDSTGWLTVDEPIAPGRLSRFSFTVRALDQASAIPLDVAWRAVARKRGAISDTVPILDEGIERVRLVSGVQPPAYGDIPADAARIAAETFEIVFPRNRFGYGVGWIYEKPAGRIVGALPWLIDGEGLPGDDAAGRYAQSFEQSDTSPARSLVFDGFAGLPGARVRLSAVKDADADHIDGQTLRYVVEYPVHEEFGAGDRLTGPTILAGEGSDASRREALFPGLEWLVGEETSSSAMDIDREHPHRLRWRPHPNMVTVPLMAVLRERTCLALLWDATAPWHDGRAPAGWRPDQSGIDRPSPTFASPDRFVCQTRADHMSLSVPMQPPSGSDESILPAGWTVAETGAERIELESLILVKPESTTVLDGVRAWFDAYGAAAPLPPPRSAGDADEVDDEAWTEPPREAWIRELEWSMQAYLETLWDPERKTWETFVGGPEQLKHDVTGQFMRDLMIVARLTDDEDLRRRLEDRIAEVRTAWPDRQPAGMDQGFYFGRPVPWLVGHAQSAASLIRAQGDEGGWTFQPHVAAEGVFKNMDYRKLGHAGEEGIGLTARHATTMLRAARITGNEELRAAGLEALDYMRRFRVPRASQVWEVIAHAPDILAAAEASQAYLEGYKLTGDQAHLELAVYWLQTGLPFIYQWHVEEFRFMRYATIPIFGSTWGFVSWFGQPVQWNGLSWAHAAMDLAPYDDSYAWRRMAIGILVSAMYQQSEGDEPRQDGRNDFALWPDAISTLDATKSGWVFSPMQLVDHTLRVMGYQPWPRVHRVELDGGRHCALMACGRFEDVAFADGELSLNLVAPAPLSTRMLIVGIEEPDQVEIEAQPLARRDLLPAGETGWSWNAGYALVELAPGQTGRLAIRLATTGARASQIMPVRAERIAFDFDASSQGWLATNDCSLGQVADGILPVKITGRDPYIVRANLWVDGDAVSRLRLRMATQNVVGGQVFWATQDDPTLTEPRSITFAVEDDGEMHEYVIEVGRHAMWAGQRITMLRLDPIVGMGPVKVELDYLRGE